MIKLPCFQLYDFESVYSVIVRYHALSGHLEHLDTLNELYGSRKKRIHPYLPTELALVSKQLGLDINVLLRGHTLLPLFSFFAPEITDALRECLCRGNGSAVIRAHLPHSKLNLFTGHKYCPYCVSKDVEQYGCGLWRIEHQVPGVSACPVHFVNLIGIKNCDGEADRQLVDPPKGSESKKAMESEIRLSKFAFELLKVLGKRHIQCDVIQSYRQTLEGKGLITRGGFLRYNGIREELRGYWSDLEFNSELGVTDKLSGFEFIGPMLRRKTGFPAHPLKHLLFACWLLDGDPRKYFISIDGSPIAAAPPIKSSLCTEKRVLNMLHEGLSMNRIQKVTGKSQCYVRHIAELHGIEHLTNTQAYPADVKRQVIIKAILGLHRKEIAESLDIGIGYVEQVISNTQGLVVWRKHLRHQFKVKNAVHDLTEAYELHPEWRRMDIKANHYAAFFLLYHHDKVLLESLLPPKTKPKPPGKDWGTEDERLVAAIRELNDVEHSSLSRIDNAVNACCFLRKHLDELPQTKALLGELGKLKVGLKDDD